MVTHRVGQHGEGGILAVHHGQTGRLRRGQEPVEAGAEQGLLGEREDTTDHCSAALKSQRFSFVTLQMQ